jgi:RNA polymerase sigma factor (sigma-70 family)
VSQRDTEELQYRVCVDAALYAAAFEKGFPNTTHFLISKGITGDLAEEIAQSAWCRGWQYRSQVRNVDSLGPWVNTIALNLLRRHVRHPSNSMQELFDRELGQVDHFLHLDVAKVMEGCGDVDREMLAMFYLEGLTSAEIGERMGKTALTVRVRLHRLRKRLQDLFAPGNESE